MKKSMSNDRFFYFPYLRGCSIKCSYISAQFNREQNLFPCNKMVRNTLMADPLMTIFRHCYFIKFYDLFHLLEFNSHLTGERRSTEIANDNSSNEYYPNLKHDTDT